MRIIKILAKMNLQNAQQIMLIKSAVLSTYMVMKDCDLITLMKEATGKYAIESKKIRDATERIGRISAPHTQTWNAILKWALQQNGLLPAEEELITKYVVDAKAQNKGLKVVESRVKVVRIEKAYEKTKCQIVFGLLEGTATNQVMGCSDTSHGRGREP